jgi:hypothetical protein
MRKRFGVLLLASMVAALAVPFGFALSVESTNVPISPPRALPIVAAVSPGAAFGSATISRVAVYELTRGGQSVYDAAKLIAIGTVLFGLAAAIRKAS